MQDDALSNIAIYLYSRLQYPFLPLHSPTGRQILFLAPDDRRKPLAHDAMQTDPTAAAPDKEELLETIVVDVALSERGGG